MPVDLKNEADKMRKDYANDPRAGTYNLLVYGGIGSGKTTLLSTCRKPVLIHSFDPGGPLVLADEIAKGDVIVMSFEGDDPMKPFQFKAWDDEFHRLKKIDFFSSIGTYALDSITTWAQSAMNAVLKKASRPASVPQQNDWYPQIVMLENAVNEITQLPCDCVLTGHDAMTKDDVTGKVKKDLMITGKLVRRIPLLFDEIYYATTKETSKGVDYTLLTQKTSTYQARTRLGRRGLFDMYEKPDIKALLKKAGLSTDDKARI